MRKLQVLLVVVLLLCHAPRLFSQVRDITGTVKDAAGQPIPNATIRIEGTKKGTNADADGSFKVTVSGPAKLLVTAVGYESKSVAIGSMTVVNIQLNLDTKALNEVVVTGVGVATSKKKLGISVESVTASQLPAAPTASIDQALVGKIAGAEISSTSGNPGDPVNITLRGINTVQGGTLPLIMLDGIQVRTTDLNSLDLSTIDRVEVVQGAASAALYGAQGANGVIQLFTKRGKAGTVAINFSTSYSANTYINSGHTNKANLHPYLTDGSNNIIDKNGNPVTYDQYGSIDYMSYQYGGATRYGILNPNNVNNKPYNANLKFYDHFKEMFQQGSTTNNSISIAGASDKSDYILAVSNNHTITPVMKNGYVDRTNFTANVGGELFRGFKLRSITELIYTKNTMVPGLGGAGSYGGGYGNSRGTVGNVFNFLNTSPFFDLKYKLADGTHPAYQVASGYLSINAFNPYYQAEYASGLDNKVDVLQTFDGDYKINKFIELDAKYGLNYRDENSRWTYLNQTQNINTMYYSDWTGQFAPDATGEIDNWHYNNIFQNFVASLYFRTDFQKDFHSRLPITTTTQFSYDYRKSKYSEYDSYGTSLPLSPPINISATSAQAVAEDYVEPFVTYGYLFNQIIDYGDYGGIAGGFRSDFSSAFGQGSKPFTFPHVNAYIVPSSFKGWEDAIGNTFSFFKLRAAYGQAGIQPGAFQRYPTLSQGNIGTQLVYSMPTTSNNANLGVEVSTEKEAGADLTITGSKSGDWLRTINASFTVWKRNSDHVIYSVSAPPSIGILGEVTNAISMHSNGVQFSLNLPVYQSRNFTWDFTFNIGHQVSIIDKIQGGADIILASAAGSTALVLTQGHKIGQISGYKALTSLSATNKEGTPYFDKTTYGQYGFVNGRVVDTGTRALQFTNETYPIGDPNPKFNASFINSFGYKGIVTFSFQIDWISGAHLYNQTKEWMYRDGIHRDFTQPVTINGQTEAFTAYWASAYYALGGGTSFSSHGPGNNSTKDFFWEDASFARVRNVAVAVDFAKIAKNRILKRCQVVLTGRNIFTKTKYTGMDPEIISGTVNSAFDRGVDNSTIPNIKSYQAGLNIGL